MICRAEGFLSSTGVNRAAVCALPAATIGAPVSGGPRPSLLRAPDRVSRGWHNYSSSARLTSQRADEVPQGGQRRYHQMAQASGSSTGENNRQPSAAAKQPPSNGTSKATAQKSHTAPPPGTPPASMPAANGVGSHHGSSPRPPSQKLPQQATKAGRPNSLPQQKSNAIASADPGKETRRAQAGAGASQQKQQRSGAIGPARNVSATRPPAQGQKPWPKQPASPPAGAAALATTGSAAPWAEPPGATVHPQLSQNGQQHPAQFNDQNASARPPAPTGAPKRATGSQAPRHPEPSLPPSAEAVQAPLRDLLKVNSAADHM